MSWNCASTPHIGPATRVDTYAALGGAVAFDGDTVALLLATSGNTDNGFQAVRVGPSGAIVTPPVTVAQRPFALGGSAGLARRGTEAVASWNTESGIRIARLAP